MATEDKIPNALPGISRVFILTSQFRAIVIHPYRNAKKATSGGCCFCRNPVGSSRHSASLGHHVVCRQNSLLMEYIGDLYLPRARIAVQVMSPTVLFKSPANEPSRMVRKLKSRGLTIVIVEHSAKPFVLSFSCVRRDRFHLNNYEVVDSIMV